MTKTNKELINDYRMRIYNLRNKQKITKKQLEKIKDLQGIQETQNILRGNKND